MVDHVAVGRLVGHSLVCSVARMLVRSVARRLVGRSVGWLVGRSGRTIGYSVAWWVCRTDALSVDRRSESVGRSVGRRMLLACN